MAPTPAASMLACWLLLLLLLLLLSMACRAMRLLTQNEA
jgi:hypothetical protein